MKVQRKNMCTQFLMNAEGEAFLQRILTGDKSWVHNYDPKCKAQLMEFRHKTSPGPKKFKVVDSARKVLFTALWDMEGVVHVEFLEQGQTVNSERYISTPRALKLRLRRVRRDKDSILQHDNAGPHTSRQTQDALSFWGADGPMDREPALRSAGTLLSQIQPTPTMPWHDRGFKNLRSSNAGLAIHKD
ncbi:histone-lysine N-methyltransferase SETMAR [Plakobranchus ocellatus]|uniref:Histone-lysine N-methyltransferase SETMAR n=1 Tax=Plakobranchus ocellatus TaxID=259542 RepID=A0AAV4ATX4_9GAST|nr:histone-lysine N-methyltransferase SETMAR [Plakobranchus ocellatus]